MTALAEKLKSAGADTVGAQLTAAVIEGLRLHPASPNDAWRFAGEKFGLEFTRGLMRDMGRLPHEHLGPRTRAADSVKPFKPYKPRVVSNRTLERRRRLQALVRSKYKNSAGIHWSEVGWHELPALARDGLEAKALLAAGPAHVPNDGRNVGKVLGVARVDSIIERARHR